MIDRFILLCLRNRQLIKILFFTVTFLILLLTLLPPGQIGEAGLYNYDKLGHFFIFFSWTFLYGLSMFTKKRTEAKFVLVFIAGCIFGLAIEVTQELLPIGRNLDMIDAYTDIFGSFVALLLLFLIKKRYLSHDMEKQLKNFK